MRYLGVYPTEKAMVRDILPEMQAGDPTGAVTYTSFEEKVLQFLASRAWEPDPPEVLLQAFQVIDEEGQQGYIETSRMGDLLMNKGHPFTTKETEAFLSVAKDAETGRVYYEDYVASMAADG